MSEYMIQGQTLTDIAAAIRAKNGTTTQYTPAEMPAAIQAISGGGGEPEPPDDGKTRLYIHVPENVMPGLPPPRADVPLYISQTVSNGVSIDWGDDSEPETISGTGNVNTTHHYAAGGDYVIALTVADGCELGLGTGSNGYCVMGSTSNDDRVYCSMLQKVYIGNSVTSIGAYAFSYCYSLANIIIPDSVTSIGTYAFRYCYGLTNIIIPDSVTSIGTYAFNYCHVLSNVIIPNGATNLENSVFSYCYSLASVIIPRTVTNIENYAFGYCYGAKEFHVLAETPPSIQSYTFRSIPSDCIIYVPVGTVDTYKTATNWAELADQIQEEPEV